MLLPVLVLFLLIPFVDLYILVELAGILGFFQTLALVIATGMVGAVIVRREGRNVFRKLQTSVTAQEISRNLIEGVLVAVGGLMLISPGLITDVIGVLFVVRPTRERLMLYILKRLKERSNWEVQTYEL